MYQARFNIVNVHEFALIESMKASMFYGERGNIFNDHDMIVISNPKNSLLDYVSDIYKTLIETPRAELKQVREELEESVPQPLHPMLEKEDKNDAFNRYHERKEKETPICPPTCTGDCKLQHLIFMA